MSPLPLIVIVGPTASGKSAVAMELARKYNGEIICADSRTIYKGMDIATAKPSTEDRRAVPHWGLDLVDPGESFTAADFKTYAVQKIAEIRERGHTPFLVGGTGLYVDGVIFDYQFASPNPVLRAQLQLLNLDELYAYCKNHNITLPENPKNRRHVERAIETARQVPEKRQTPLENTIIVGITTDRDVLRQRIADRIDSFLNQGVVKEATDLARIYGWDSQAMTSNAYPLIKKYIDGELTEQQLKEKLVTADWRLAKRQLTWLRRNLFIEWRARDEAMAFVAEEIQEK